MALNEIIHLTRVAAAIDIFTCAIHGELVVFVADSAFFVVGAKEIYPYGIQRIFALMTMAMDPPL